MVMFLLTTILIAGLQRGRGRGRGRGCGRGDNDERIVIENSDLCSIDRNIADGQDGLSEENNNICEEETDDLRTARKPRSHSTGDYGKPPPQDKIKAISVADGQ